MTSIKKVEAVNSQMTCESCGKEFSCGANVGKCWCFEVEVDEKTLAQLQKDYKSCLCEDCLRKLHLQEKVL